MFSLDASTTSAILIGSASLLGWLYTQATSRAKAMRKELRWRRRNDGLRDRYIFRLEQGYNSLDRSLPEKPPGLIELEEEPW